MRHLCRQQARRVRGIPQRNPALGGPRQAPASHRRGHPRLRGTLAATALAVGLTLMARHGNAVSRRASRSPLVLDISRLGRRPGSMMTISETVPSPVRIGLDLIAIDE